VGWLFVALALPLLALVRIAPVDIPWHLATARLHDSLGHWPTRNTFSWTFPDYTLYQQYPVFQTIAWAGYRLGGWAALSALVFVWWSAVFALFVRAAGPWRRALPFHLSWGLVAFSLQTRSQLRPDLVSLSLLALSIIVLDLYRLRGRRFIALLPVLHWLWVNGHQLFILSLLVQGLFIAHLLLARWGRVGVDRTDAGLPVWPPLLALAASLAVSFLSPLGPAILHVLAQTSGSLAHHRADVQELARVWSDPVWLTLGLVIAVPAAVALARSWRAWNPFDLGLWLISMAIAAAAVRGLVYGTLVSGWVVQRTLLRQPITWRPSAVLSRFFRVLAVCLCGVLTFSLLHHRWLRPSSALGDVQAGVGRSQGEWATAAIATLRAEPPPGRMMNIPWTSGNQLVWEWPEEAVFVDPRFEGYPRPFLIDVLAARRDDGVLDRLIATHDPSWIYLDHCTPLERQRLAHLTRTGEWQPTYADPQVLVLVQRSPATASYRARHPLVAARDPAGLVATPARRARQRLCYAQLLDTLGLATDARAALEPARAEAADEPALGAEIARALQVMGTSAQ
jgi:hypothetical protein